MTDRPLDFTSLDSRCIRRSSSMAEYIVQERDCGGLRVAIRSRIRNRLKGTQRFREWQASIFVEHGVEIPFTICSTWRETREDCVAQAETLLRIGFTCVLPARDVVASN